MRRLAVYVRTASAAGVCLVGLVTAPSVLGNELPPVEVPAPAVSDAAETGPREEPAPPDPSGTEPRDADAAARPGDEKNLRATQAADDDGGSVEAAGDDRDCADFNNQEEAQDYFESQGGDADNNVDNLDADGDGIACEGLASSAPSGGVDTGGGGTAVSSPGDPPGPAGAIGAGALLGLVLGMLFAGRRRAAQ